MEREAGQTIRRWVENEEDKGVEITYMYKQTLVLGRRMNNNSPLNRALREETVKEIRAPEAAEDELTDLKEVQQSSEGVTNSNK